MATLKDFVMVTKSQYTQLLNGQTVGGHVYDPSALYLVEAYDDPQAKTIIEERAIGAGDITVDGKNKFLHITITSTEAQDRSIIFAPGAFLGSGYEWGYEKGFKTTLFIQGMENLQEFNFNDFFGVAVDVEGDGSREVVQPYIHPFSYSYNYDSGGDTDFSLKDGSGYTTIECGTQGSLSLGPVDMTISLKTSKPTIYFHGPVVIREEQQ